MASRSTMQNLDNINVAEVLDRVLDHCIVMDLSTRIFLLGVDLRSLKGRLVVESVQTCC
ncbi:MAG TPA: hypothetical protein VJW55_00500 [Candidatus Angelobacter sp.]|nr:hypothetical protein [Candidatus Angelobacter sp.]HKR93808.1 hypothetical protein [Candidatus Angelobacter sp.]